MEDKKLDAVAEEKDYILQVDGLKQHFPISKDFFGKPVSFLRAVDGVSFKLEIVTIGFWAELIPAIRIKARIMEVFFISVEFSQI